MIVKPKIVEKAWGQEIWIHNDGEYCGKLLRFKKDGSMFSMHYHVINTETAEEDTAIIGIGTCITIERGQPHQLVALEDNSEIFEVSTQHFDSDSYRIRKGDSQI